MAARRRRVQLRERREEPADLRLGESFACVDHFEMHCHTAVCRSRLRLEVDCYGHRSLFGELDGVANQVDQHLAKAERIAKAEARDFFGDIGGD